MPSPFTVEITPTRKLWLRARNTGLGGSDAPTIMGHSPWKTPYRLWLEKTGRERPEDISDSPKVLAGTLSEPLIRRMFANRHRELEVTAGNDLFGAQPGSVVTLRSTSHPFMLGDLDGIAVDEAGVAHVLEIKTAHMPSASQWDEGVPAHYLDQVDHYLALTGLSGAYVVVWIDGWDYREFFVPRDEARIAALVAAEEKFWNHVTADTPPAPESAPDLAYAHSDPSKEMRPLTGEEAKAAAELIAAYTTSRATEKEAKAAADAAAIAIEKMVGDFKGISTPVGDAVWLRRRVKRVDRKAMEKDAPDVVGAYRALEDTHAVETIQNGGIRIKEPKIPEK